MRNRGALCPVVIVSLAYRTYHSPFHPTGKCSVLNFCPTLANADAHVQAFNIAGRMSCRHDPAGAMQADAFIASWMNGSGGVSRTPAYLSWLGPTSTLRNTANAAFLAWTYQKNSGGTVRGKHRCWAEYQVCRGAAIVSLGP